MEQLLQLYSKVGFRTNFTHSVIQKLCKKIGLHPPQKCYVVNKSVYSYICYYDQSDIEVENSILTKLIDSGFQLVNRFCTSSQIKLRGYLGDNIKVTVDIFMQMRTSKEPTDDDGQVFITLENIKE